MKEMRLLPVLMACGGALLAMKVSGLVLLGHYALPLPGIAPAMAQSSEPQPADAVEEKPMEDKADPKAMEATAEADKMQAPESRETAQGRIVKPGEDTGAKAAVLERLGERRTELDLREKELDLREGLLNAAEARIATRVQELKEIEARITAAVEKKDAEKKAQLQSLVIMYETMKPKDAARIFSELDLGVLVDVVNQMNARKMAEILANMEVKAAERLTLAIAAKSREDTFAVSPQDLPKIEGKPQS